MPILASLLCFFFLLPLASAQQYTISTVAGLGQLPFGGGGGPAAELECSWVKAG